MSRPLLLVPPEMRGRLLDGSQCTLTTRLSPAEQRQSRRLDSAIETYPGATSDCPTLCGTQQVLGTSFESMCGIIIAGNDIGQDFAPTFQDRLARCASTSGCAGLSFDPSQTLGFKNWYLKTAVANSIASRRTNVPILRRWQVLLKYPLVTLRQ
ncbi:hypothetical protein VTK56DRAFT_5023 [Thermocarpiscus australiensis]